MIALIDGDMVAYRAAFLAETEIMWNDQYWTLHSEPSKMQTEAIRHVGELMDEANCDSVELAFSSKKNFRKDLNPLYKSNRKTKRKPLGLGALVEWMSVNWKSYTVDNLEADDVIGIMASKPNNNYIAVSGDKDFKTIPCKFYDFTRKQFHDITKTEADFTHLCQTLAGDPTDGYSGLKGFGMVTAEKYLNKHGATWKSVVDAYTSKGSNETEALLNARMAYILRHGDYTKSTKKIKLWNS